VVVYALVQTEAGITELIYLVCVFAVVTDLVFNYPGRVYETAMFELYQFVVNGEKVHTELEIDFGYRRSLGYRGQYSRILEDTIRTGQWNERQMYLSTSIPFLLLETISNKNDFSSLKVNQGMTEFEAHERDYGRTCIWPGHQR
jgi:hypothetical protein